MKLPTRTSLGSPVASGPAQPSPASAPSAVTAPRAATSLAIVIPRDELRAGSLVRGWATRFAPVAEPIERLPDQDHAEEDQADDQHRRDHLSALLGGGGALLLGRRREQGHQREGEGRHGATLTDQSGVGLQRPLDALVARRLARKALERPGVTAFAELCARNVEPPLSDQRGRRRPGGAVAAVPVSPRLGAQGDQLCEVAYRVDIAQRRNPREALRVEVVTEDERRVVVRRLEEPWPAVVHEVALVDRLQPERIPRLGEAREDRLELALGRLAPHARELRRRNRQPRPPSSRSPRRRARGRRTSPRIATARRRRPARGDGGRAPRSARCPRRRAWPWRQLARCGRAARDLLPAELRGARAPRRRRRREGDGAPRDPPLSQGGFRRAFPPGRPSPSAPAPASPRPGPRTRRAGGHRRRSSRGSSGPGGRRTAPGLLPGPGGT